MKYVPLKEGNKWATSVCSSNGNGGIHDQTQLRAAVAMLETAAASWSEPRLMHLVLTGADRAGYRAFIDRMKRHLPVRAYKAATEVDPRKGEHVHWMLIIDDSSPMHLFDHDDDSSAIAKEMLRTQRTYPEFDAFISKPYRHHTPFIPVNAQTLDDAVDWFSYALKARSKPAGGNCYWSSRRSSSRCAAGQSVSKLRPERIITH